MVKSKLLSRFNKVSHSFVQKSDERLEAEVDFVNQVHSTRVIFVEEMDKNLRGIDADGMITQKKRCLGVKTADCLPVLIYDPVRNIVGAVHGGWKGLAGGILKNAIKLLRQRNSNPSDIFVAVGPHIKSCCYKVQSDRVGKFIVAGVDKESIVRQDKKDLYLDLGKFARWQLRELGVPASQIEVSEVCTCCNLRFSSFRREGENCGRMISLISLSQ